MKYEKNLEIMMAAIQAETGYPDDQLRMIRGGVIDGFLRIERMEIENKRALDPVRCFPVERVQEGYGIWNNGGFDVDRGVGKATVAAGADGEKLRIVRYCTTKNEDHSLSVIYPGCYIASAMASDPLMSDCIKVYQVISFVYRDVGWAARCRKVLQTDPRMTLLSDDQEDRLARLLTVANRIALTPNLTKLRDWV